MTLAQADQILDRGDDSPQPPTLWLIKKVRADRVDQAFA